MIHVPVPSLDGLTTERLVFRKPVLEDRNWWMEYINDAEAIRFMGFTPGSTADCERFLQFTLDRHARDGSGLHVITERASGKPVGMVGLLTQEVDGIPELEIGYHLVPSVWGHGFATEAAAACKEFARAHRLAPTLVSLIHPDNTKSQAVAKRNGMVFDERGMHRGEEVLVFRIRLENEA